MDQSLPVSSSMESQPNATALDNPSTLKIHSLSAQPMELAIKASAPIDTGGESPHHATLPLTEEVIDDEKKRQRRLLVVAELIETERGYLADLGNLVRNVFDSLNNVYLSGVATVRKKETTNAAEIAHNTTFGNEDTDGWITFDQKQAIVRNGSHLLRAQKLFTKMLEDAASTDKALGIELLKETPVSNRPIATGLTVGDPSVISIARCFLNFMQKLEAVYLPFCSLHDTALETLAVLRKAHSSQFNAFVEDCRSKMHSKLELQDFLIKPVQRICKYPLLLTELLKSTPLGSLDHQELTDALSRCKELVSKINDQKKWAENERKKELLLGRLQPGYAGALQDVLEALQLPIEKDLKSLADVPAAPEKLGKLFRSCGLLTYHHEEHELPFVTSLPRHAGREFDYLGIFLFKEVILVAFAKKSSMYQLINVIKIADIVNLQEMHNDTAGHHDANVLQMKYSFRLTWQVRDAFRSIDFGMRSEKELRAWLSELGTLIPAEKIAYHLIEENMQALDSSKNRTSKAISFNSGDTFSIMNDDYINETSLTLQAAADLKFSDVFTMESLVLGKVGASANQSLSANAIKNTAARSTGTLIGASTPIKNFFSSKRETSQSASTRKSVKSIFGGAVSKENVSSGVKKVTDLPQKNSSSMDIFELLDAHGVSPPSNESPISITAADKLSSMPNLAIGKAKTPDYRRSVQDNMNQVADGQDSDKYSISSIRTKLKGFGITGKKETKSYQSETAEPVVVDRLERSQSLRARSSNHMQPSTDSSSPAETPKRSLFGSLRRTASQKAEYGYKKRSNEAVSGTQTNVAVASAQPSKSHLKLTIYMVFL
jgi:hypothetical protein